MYYLNPCIQNLVRVFDQNERKDYLRLDLNENPGGLPREFVESVLAEVTPQMVAQYPETLHFTQVLADYIGTDIANICITNGSAEAIRYVIQAFTAPNGRIVGVVPSYFMFQVYSEMYGRDFVKVPYNDDLTISIDNIEQELSDDTQMLILLNPNNPMGNVYTDEEFETMLCDTRLMMENGADGIAFGCLTKDGEIDVVQTKQIIDIIKEYNGEVVFHRAFDCVKNADEAMETLISLHVDRVLTSGLKAKAMDGIDMIAHLQEKYGDKIQILAGSGMNASNALEMMEKTGIWQVHSSCKSWRNDPTTSGVDVNYCYAAAPHENDYDVVSEELVRKIVNSVC